MFNQPEIQYLWVSLFLIACAIMDFYWAKISNKFITASFGLSILLILIFSPPNLWLSSLLSFIILFVVGFLLFNFKILGGGDIKALCIVALFLQPSQLQSFLIYSLIWAGAYSLIFYLISGQVFLVLMNTLGVFKKLTQANHRIPFTFGILLGWFSLFTLGVISW